MLPWAWHFGVLPVFICETRKPSLPDRGDESRITVILPETIVAICELTAFGLPRKGSVGKRVLLE